MTAPTDKVRSTQADSDAIDAEFAARGDGQAFERLYRRHVDRIHSLARWLLGHEDVDDAIQDVFVRAWHKLDTFKGRSAFGTWLHRLATNVLLRRRERVRTDEFRFATDEPALDRAAASSANPALRVDLEAAVDRLPPGARQVFVLYDMEGYKHEEIARLLDISVGTSRSQLHHARMALRGYFTT